MNIVILGQPGAGKGTVCEQLIKDYNYNFICAGDLLRDEKKSNSALGQEISNIIDKGNLVPDYLISEMILNQISNSRDEFFLIDGYPRTIGQAKDLDKMINVHRVIWLNVSDETTITRNLKRGQTFGRPDDSKVEIIKQRLENYKKDTEPLKQYYSDKLIQIDGEGKPEEVYSKIVNILFEAHKYTKETKDIL